MAKIIRGVYAPAFLIIMWGMFAAGLALAQQEDFKEYTVKKGDTLWGISSKEMFDPFLWPKVWKENPEVKNPDLIYPGQKIRIPLSVIQKQVPPTPPPTPPTPPPPPVEKVVPVPQPKPPAKKPEAAVVIPAVKKSYLVDENLFISSGYIVDTVNSKGTIIGAPTERIVVGKDDYVYIKTVNPVRKGDKFYVIRPPRKVLHPGTGRMLGYVIEIVGTAQVVGEETGHIKTKLTESFVEILEGYALIDYYEMEPPYPIDAPRTPDVNGFIVGTKESHISIIVYIDKGRKDGIEVGDLLGIVSRGRFDIPNGYLQVIKIQDSTATAIIRKYEKEIIDGDLITKLTPPVK
jgi:hypothetical protein